MPEEEDDELLMEAAGQWAASKQNKSKKKSKSEKSKKEKKDKKSTKDKPIGELDTLPEKVEGTQEKADQSNSNNTTQQVFSLHLTKVPYEATRTDLRYALREKGCNVTAVRFVYDHKSSGEKSFRGVAFVDLADEASFKKGLELHGTKFLGNRHNVNVRPTKSKGELSEIVRKTQEKVAILIARSKEKAREERESNPDAYDAKKEAKKEAKRDKWTRKRGRNSDPNPDDTKAKKSKKSHGDDLSKQSSSQSSNYKEGNKAAPSKDGERKKKQDKAKSKKSDVKLTKKQRAKKAAVINMLKRKKMK